MEDEQLLRGHQKNTRYESPSHDHHHHHNRTCLKIAGIFLLVIFLILFLFTLAISILSPIVWSKFAVMIAQNALNSAVMTIESGTLSNARQDGVSLSSVITLSQTGAVAGNLSGANLTVYYKNKAMAFMQIPPASFGAGAATTYVQSAELNITDKVVFKQQAMALMQGQQVAWRLSGPVTVTFKQLGMTLDLDLHLEKDIVLDGGAPQNVTAWDLNVIQGVDNDTLLASVSQYLYNPSNIAVIGLGEVVMDSFDQNRVKIGQVIVPDFQILSGDNYQDKVIIKTVKTPENEQAIRNFMSNWAMGIDQTTYLVGPISLSSGIDYFANVTDFSAVIKGYSGPPLVSNATLGSLSPSQVVYNPINTTVTQSDFRFRISALPIPAGPNSKPMYTSFSVPSGITCQANEDAGYVSLLDKTITISGLNSSFAALQADSSDPCSYYTPFAICCGYYSGLFDKNNYTAVTPAFKINAQGSFNVLIGNFTITQDFTANNLDFSCFPPGIASFLCSGASALVNNVCLRPTPGQTCVNSVYNPQLAHYDAMPNTNTSSPQNIILQQTNGTWVSSLGKVTEW